MSADGKHDAVRVVGYGFLGSCVVTTAIDQGYQEYGMNICYNITSRSSEFDQCRQAARQQAADGYATIFVVIWLVITLAIFRLTSNSGS
jgi:hypothetical protein